MEKVHCMSSSSIHIHYNHDPVQAQLCTQRVWERPISTFRTEYDGPLSSRFRKPKLAIWVRTRPGGEASALTAQARCHLSGRRNPTGGR